MMDPQDIARLPGNRVCAECPERNPRYASLVRPHHIPETVGVFVCDKCSRHHFRMGRHVCEVRPLTSEWTEEEAEILRYTGNDLVNSILEGQLEDPDSFENDKEIFTTDEKEEAKLRSAFIKNKYVHGKYFCQEAYDAVMTQHEGSDNFSEGSDEAFVFQEEKKQEEQPSALERNVKESSSKSSPAQRSKGRRRARGSVAFDITSRQLAGLTGDHSESHGDNRDSEEANIRSAHRRSSGSVRRQRRASTATSSKLDNFISSENTRTRRERGKGVCKSVTGTSDTEAKLSDSEPKLYGDRVYEGVVDVSADELRAARARRKKRHSTKRSQMSQSERTRSPRGVRDNMEGEDKRMTQSERSHHGRRSSDTSARRMATRERIRRAARNS